MTISPDLQERILAILEELEQGTSRADMCRTYGVSPETLQTWICEYGTVSGLRRALLKRSRQFDELQEVARLGSWQLDLSTKEAIWSRQLYLLLGYEEGDVEATPEHFIDRIHPEDLERVMKALDRPFEHPGEEYAAEFRLLMPDGRIRHVAERGRVIAGEEGQSDRYLGTTLDITRRKQAEEEQERLRAQLAQAQKMESIGRLAGGVAHDFNNMLSAILGHADLVLGDLSADDPMRESIEEICSAANRSADLTQQLLAFSRKQVIAPRVVDLPLLLERMRTMLQRLIGEQIILQTSLEHEHARIRADPSQIEQIILNLAINARDAMPDGGELLLETSSVLLDEVYCEERLGASPGVHVTLAVSDTGCGMSPEIRKRIFEPFFTTKEVGEGTGLGLAMVFGIVQQNGGRIEVYSELGSGTTFKVFFPRVTQDEEVQPPTRSSDSPGGEETLLVVEDENLVRQPTVKILERLGYEILAARSGAEAVSLIEEHQGGIDLLLTDVVMPRMNGNELALKAVAMCPGMKVLYSSGYAEEVTVHRGVLEEGVQFIAKPFQPDTLAVRVREMLDQAPDAPDSTS